MAVLRLAIEATLLHARIQFLFWTSQQIILTIQA